MRPIEQLEVRVLPLSQLRPAPYNPRKPVQPGSPVWRKLEQSLREFGLVEPLVYNLTTGHIVGGHLRLAILKHLGVKQVPVSVVQLDPPQEKASERGAEQPRGAGQLRPAPARRAAQ
jgi:ParB-like chromosome segregation protein Spo0J